MVERIVRKALSFEKNKKTGDITVCFVDDRQIKKLNRKYLGHNYATDVMAFDISEQEDVFFADIIISADTAMKNALVFKTDPYYELCLYVAHGVLHIIGYDDRTKALRACMDRKADRILSALKIKDIGERLNNE